MKLIEQLREQLADQSMWPAKWIEDDVQYGKLDSLELPEYAEQQLFMHRYLYYNMIANPGKAFYPKPKIHFAHYFGYAGGHSAMVDAVMNKTGWYTFKAEMDAKLKREAGGVEEPFPAVPIQPADHEQAQTEIENESPRPVQQIPNADIQPPSPIVDASGPTRVLLTPEAAIPGRIYPGFPG